MGQEKKIRESGIELLKIFSIFVIVLTHVIQTLSYDAVNAIGVNDYLYYFAMPTTTAKGFIISFLYQCGNIANMAFFICSAWFLTEKDGPNPKKAFNLISNNFAISVLWLIAIVFGFKVYLGSDLIAKSFLPTYYENNWYVTQYVLFLFVYPFLNKIIESLSQRNHLIAAIGLFLTFMTVDFFFGIPSSTMITLWTAVYFIISYFKKYGVKFSDGLISNICLLLVGLLGMVGLMFYANSKALMFDNIYDASLRETLTTYGSKSSIFGFFVAFALFNLFRQIKFKCRFINYISSLSLFVYIIHENILFRIYIRPRIWEFIYNKTGYENLIGEIFIFALLLFLASIIVAILYKETLGRLVKLISGGIYKALCFLFGKLTDLLFKAIK